jgi:DNA-binding NtrC family response regulator
VAEVQLLPLCDRSEDVVLVALHLLTKLAAKQHTSTYWQSALAP